MGKNNPYQVLYYTLNGSVFSNDNHRYYVTGDIDDVKNITLDEINLVYNTFYHPSNMFLTVTGNFDPEYLSVVIKENQNNKEFKPYLEPEKIKEMLINSNITDYETHKKHIKYAEKVKSRKQEENISKCPKCGGNLVLRNGKYGKFIGCSNYPKCTYTKEKKY